MALTKQIKVDKIEVVGDFKAVQVRTAPYIMDDGEEISRSYHRHVITAGQDYSNETAEVQAICLALHTPEVIAAYETHLAANQLGE